MNKSKFKSFLSDNKTNTYIFVAISFVLFVVWYILLCNGDELQNGFFLKCNDRFADHINVLKYSRYRLTYVNVGIEGNEESAYLPLTYVIYHFLGKVFTDEMLEHAFYMNPIVVQAALTMVVSSVLVVLQLFDMKKGDKLQRFLVSLAFLMSGVFLFTLERGNTIIFTLALIIFYINNYDSESKVAREISYICLAIAAALKITPALLGVLLLSKGRWKDALRTILYGVIFCFGPFLLMQGNLSDNVTTFINSVVENNSFYSDREFGCGLQSMATVLAWENVDTLMTVLNYTFAGLIVLAFPLRKEKWLRVIAITMLIIMLPAHSGKYNMLYLFPTIVLFLDREKKRIIDIAYFVLFIIILSPIQFQFAVTGTNQMIPIIASILFMLLALDSLMEIVKNIKILPRTYINTFKDFFSKTTAIKD